MSEPVNAMHVLMRFITKVKTIIAAKSLEIILLGLEATPIYLNT